MFKNIIGKPRRFLIKCIPPTGRTLNSDWVSEGPSASETAGTASFNGLGRVDRIAFHPTDVQTIYLGTPMGGLWKTRECRRDMV